MQDALQERFLRSRFDGEIRVKLFLHCGKLRRVVAQFVVELLDAVERQCACCFRCFRLTAHKHLEQGVDVCHSFVVASQECLCFSAHQQRFISIESRELRIRYTCLRLRVILVEFQGDLSQTHLRHIATARHHIVQRSATFTPRTFRFQRFSRRQEFAVRIFVAQTNRTRNIPPHTHAREEQQVRVFVTLDVVVRLHLIVRTQFAPLFPIAQHRCSIASQHRISVRHRLVILTRIEVETRSKSVCSSRSEVEFRLRKVSIVTQF